jgi:hypothetical protein
LKYNFDKQEVKELIKRDPKFLIFKSTQFDNVIKHLNSLDIKPAQIFEMIKQYPDILLSNRYSILEKKLELFNDLNLNKATIRNLIKRYPFILLKSYNSFVKKVLYFNDMGMKIESTDIYPLIYVFNLDTDIKPRCEIMKKYNKWIPFKEAFSLTADQFAEKMGVNKSEFDSYASPSLLHERDVFFRYSKYLTY